MLLCSALLVSCCGTLEQPVNTKKNPILYQKNPRSGAKCPPPKKNLVKMSQPPPPKKRYPKIPMGGEWCILGFVRGFFLYISGYISGGFMVHFAGFMVQGGALSAVHAQCNYLGVWPYWRPML